MWGLWIGLRDGLRWDGFIGLLSGMIKFQSVSNGMAIL